MNQTAWRCWAALCVAAWAASAPLHAVADNNSPETGQNARPAAESLPASKMGKRETYPFRGVVASVDITANTVTLGGKSSRRVIAVIPETRWAREGGPATLSDLKAGEAIGGTLRKTGDGREEALLIRIGAKPEGKPAAKSKASARAPKPDKEDAPTH